MKDNELKVFQRSELEEFVDSLNVLVLRAYEYAEKDPFSSMVVARKIAEAICDHLLIKINIDKSNLPTGLKNKIEVLRKKNSLPETIDAYVSTILIWGNLGAHFRWTEHAQKDIIITLCCVQGLMNWFCKEYQFDPIPWSDIAAKAFSASNSSEMLNSDQIPLDSVAFISEIMKDPQNVESVCMAFHAGAEWRYESEKAKLINFIQKNNIPLYVIVNNGATINKVSKHMKRNKEYIGFARSIRQWRKVEKDSNGSIQVRISRLPLLHRSYIVRYKNQTGVVNVKYYTYRHLLPDHNHRAAFSSDTKEYALYAEEFNHLWKNARPPFAFFRKRKIFSNKVGSR